MADNQEAILLALQNSRMSCRVAAASVTVKFVRPRAGTRDD